MLAKLLKGNHGGENMEVTCFNGSLKLEDILDWIRDIEK